MKKALGILAVAALLPGVTASPGMSAERVLNGCVKKGNGQLRLVMNLRSCKPSEHPISWNTEGPMGPAGPQGAAGPQGSVGPQGAAGPQGEPGNDVPVMQLAGFTTAPLVGHVGALELNIACRNQFSESRLCTSEEVLNTGSPPALTAVWAWVRPSFSPLATASAGPSVVDASGVSGDPAEFTCGGWKETTPFKGLAVDNTGAFDLMDCGAAMPVACCAPVPPEPAP